jgi:hypothetical protein
MEKPAARIVAGTPKNQNENSEGLPSLFIFIFFVLCDVDQIVIVQRDKTIPLGVTESPSAVGTHTNRILNENIVLVAGTCINDILGFQLCHSAVGAGGSSSIV